jgi:Fur family zinc uptake transcriptional regulator
MKHAGFGPHNHDDCIATAIAAADKISAGKGLQLTPIRRRVLEILLAKHRAIGAYEILEVLRAEGRAAQPPVAYRALDFLVSNGFAHRIESLNAFVACSNPGEAHHAAFLVCRKCAAVAETDGQTSGLDEAAKAAGFDTESRVIEAEGICPSCREDTQA